MRTSLCYFIQFALYILRPFLHVNHCVNSVNVKFMSLSIDFIAPILVTSTSDKITRKMHYSMSKGTTFEGETTLCHTLLCSDSQCLPPGDPRILCA